MLIPNGVDTDSIKPSNKNDQVFAKNELGIETPHVAIFMGSGYGPNTQAVSFIAENLLHKHPDVTFLILGGVRESYYEYANQSGKTKLPSISKTGLGDGWFESEVWEGKRKVRWTQKKSLIGVISKEEGTLEFEALANQKKKLQIAINGKPTQTIKIIPKTWKTYSIPLKGQGPFVVQIETSFLNEASQSDPRRVGVAVSNMVFSKPGRGILIEMDQESGNDALGDRLKFLGIVSEEKKKLAFAAAGVALNPMFQGSGSNIKMFEFLAAGLPTITTSLGARGIEGDSGTHYLISPGEDFSACLESLLINRTLRESLGKMGRELAEDKFDWKKIAEKAETAIKKVMNEKGII